MKEKNIDFITIEKLVKKYRNDYDLGGVIREIYWENTMKNDEEGKKRNL